LQFWFAFVRFDRLDWRRGHGRQALAAAIDFDLRGTLAKVAEGSLGVTGHMVGLRHSQPAMSADEVPETEGRRR
jgi:hypothetical protein